DLVRLLERSQGWPVGSVDACQLKGPATVVAASGIKLRAVIRESKQMPIEQKFKPGASSLHLDFGVVVFSLRRQHVGEAPIYLRVANRSYRPQQRLRLAEIAVRTANFGQMDTGFCVPRQDGDCLPIPVRCQRRIGL